MIFSFWLNQSYMPSFMFQTKYALLDEQDIGLVEQYAFEVSDLIFPAMIHPSE